MFEGMIIKETITDESLLDCMEIENVEIWKTEDPQIRYWTMLTFKSKEPDFPEKLSQVIIEDWFADMKANGRKYIVFADEVFSYEIGNMHEKELVLEFCRSKGIPESQLNWDE